MGIIERITEAEAIRDISGLLDRVRVDGVSVEIVRGDSVVARLSPGLADALETANAPKHGTIDALLKALDKVPAAPAEECEAWERELADLRRQSPTQVREWD